MVIPFFVEGGSAEHEVTFAKKLAKSVGIELQEIFNPSESTQFLKMHEHGLNFYLAGTRGPVLNLDLAQEYASFMRQVSKTAAGPLKKALGRTVKKGDTVVDASCGTGKDSLLFLTWGLKVLAFERNPLMFLLLQMAWQSLVKKYPEVAPNFELVFGDVRAGATRICEGKISALYFDPMFSEGRKGRRSLPRQEMVVFKELVGADYDQESVMASLLKLPLTRIVVKRPSKAPDFAGPLPLASFPGKSVRYDLFRGA
ncbi:MAG: hypothetical protein A2X86_13230 [Bdellovibrionales bacterium GWA2_49_15]|nr:MAG: hypothetical protein A2X86_13230 [Bdellovibrionales bacterium GWA2_49_15]HAZ13487.1 hypothetical protein [Bdellovibrionales bacterium]